MKPSICRIVVTLLTGCFAAAALAQRADFKVLWSTLGNVVSTGKDAAKVQPGSKIVRVDVEPAIVNVAVGKQLCLSTLQVRAIGPDSQPLAGAPLSISIREDQKVSLQLTHPKGDICMRPARAGEYPVRFTSKLPAPDDTRRGAQLFLRAT